MQRLLEDENMRSTMLKYLPDEELAEKIRSEWENVGTSKASKSARAASAEGGDINLQRWRILESIVHGKVRILSRGGASFLPRCTLDLIYNLRLAHPRF
jgi:hypothetical protein